MYETPVNEEGETHVEFKKITVKMQRLCMGNRKLPLRFSVYSYVGVEKSPLLYGHFESFIDEIQANLSKTHLLRDAKGKESGTINFPAFEVLD